MGLAIRLHIPETHMEHAGVRIKRRPPLRDLLTEFEKLYASHVQFEKGDETAIRFVVGCIISMWLADAQELAWGMLVAPPSGGKTEALRPLFDWPRAVLADKLTAQAMSSGYDPNGIRSRARMKGEDDPNPSLLPRLDGKVLICKDMAGILGNKELASAIFGALRSAFDGRYDSQSGTLGEDSSTSRFGFIAATTPPAYDKAMSQLQDKGDRCITYRLAHRAQTWGESDRRGERAISRRQNKHKIREDLTAKATVLLEECIEMVTAWGTSHSRLHAEHIQRPVRRVASLAARIKTVPGALGVTDHERCDRLTQQLSGLLDAVAICEGRRTWDQSDKDLACRVARDTIPSHLLQWWRFICARCWCGDPRNAATSEQIHEAIGFVRPELIDNQLRQWAASGLAERDTSGRIHVPSKILQECVETGLILKPNTPRRKRR